MEIKEPIQIKKYLETVLTKQEYDMWIEPITEHTINEKTVIEVPDIFFKNKISEILKLQNLSAEIIIHAHQELKITEPQKDVEIRQSLVARTLQMEKPYSKEKVATSDIINSKFFTYPTSRKTKYSIKKTTINKEDYIIHRGKTSPNPKEEPIGQLDTNHLRILLALIHTWQEQNCQFLGINAVIKISLSIREIAKKIGYKISGQTIKWLQKKINELSQYPITLEKTSKGKATSFTFLNEITKKTEQNKRKSIIVLTFNPILSEQLYNRKAILRLNTCYKIKNPTSLKFLLTYDKRIYASQEPFKLSLEEIAEELELRGTKDNKLSTLKKVIKNLNGYKITETEEISLELVKEGRERYLIVGKREVVQELPEGTTLQCLAP